MSESTDDPEPIYVNTAVESVSLSSTYRDCKTKNCKNQGNERSKDVTLPNAVDSVATLRRMKIICFVQLVVFIVTVTAFGIILYKMMNNLDNKPDKAAHQVGFTARGNTMVSDILSFGSLETNYGNGFSISTGKFTCSNPGLYFFALSLIKERKADRVFCYIVKNNRPLIFTETDPRDDATDNGSHETSAFIVLHLSHGDTVHAGRCSNNSSINKYSSFTGFLLQSD